MENKRKNSGDDAERLRNELQDAQDNAKQASKEVKDLKVKEHSAKEERDVLNTDMQQQTKDKTRFVQITYYYLVVYKKGLESMFIFYEAKQF